MFVPLALMSGVLLIVIPGLKRGNTRFDKKYKRRRKIMKKWLAFALILCMVMPLVVACSSGTTATTAPTTAAEATETPWVFDGANYKGEVKVGILLH
jgi:uncharacterized BrkB/YihY/UPF0761 family membrane protein